MFNRNDSVATKKLRETTLCNNTKHTPILKRKYRDNQFDEEAIDLTRKQLI